MSIINPRENYIPRKRILLTYPETQKTEASGSIAAEPSDSTRPVSSTTNQSSMADRYYNDRSTKTLIFFPSGWDECISEIDSFSYCFRDNEGSSYNYNRLFYDATILTNDKIPWNYRKAPLKKKISSLFHKDTTTSYPIEMYAELYDLPKKYISIVTLGGIKYMRIDKYKATNPREHK